MDMDEVDADPSVQSNLPKETRQTKDNVVLRKIKTNAPLKLMQTDSKNVATCALNDIPSTLVNIKQWISSPHSELQLQGIKTARSLLCTSAGREALNANNSALLNMSILPDCIKFLMSDNTKLISETTWLLSNIAAGNESHTECLIKAGVIQPIILLLKSSEPDIVEHCVRTLGNCMAENEEIRLKILNMRVIPPLVNTIKLFRNHISIMRTLAFTLVHASKVNLSAAAQSQSNALLKDLKLKYDSSVVSTSSRSIFQTEQILLGVQTLILSKDTDVQASACWIIFYLSCNGIAGVESVLRAGLLPKLMFLLTGSDDEVIVPCLKAIGNIARIKTQIDELIKYGILISLAPFLKSSNVDLVFLSIWILSCISEGTENHRKEILEFCVVEDIAALIESDYIGMHIKNECLFIMKNLTATTTDMNNSPKVMEKIQKSRLMEIIVHCLEVKDPSVIELSLKTLENIFLLSSKSEGKYRFALSEFENNYGTERLQDLAYHLNFEISKKACEILDGYFPDGGDGDNCQQWSNSSPESSRFVSASECESSDDDNGLYL